MKTVSTICLLTAAAVAAPTFTGPAAGNISQGGSGSFANVSSALVGKRDIGNTTLPTVTNVTTPGLTAQAEKRQFDETLPSLSPSSLSIPAVPTALTQGQKRHIGLGETLPSLDLSSLSVTAIPTASIASLNSSSIV